MTSVYTGIILDAKIIEYFFVDFYPCRVDRLADCRTDCQHPDHQGCDGESCEEFEDGVRLKDLIKR
jgi:hypothetical protein